MFNLNGIIFDEIFEYKHSTRTRANHKYTLYTKLPRLDCYEHSFFIRIVKEWNALPSLPFPSQVVEVDVSKFKCALRTHMNMFR